MYIETNQRRAGGCAETLFYIAVIVVVLGFAAAMVVRSGMLDASGTAAPPLPQPAQVRPTAPRPTYAPPPTTDYGIAAYNERQQATATALQAAPGATEAPAAIPTPAPAWHAPMAPDFDVCAAWHAPLPWPAECGAQEGWHAPMVVKP